MRFIHVTGIPQLLTRVGTMAILVAALAAGAASSAEAATPLVTASPETLHLRSFELDQVVVGTVRLTNASRKLHRIHFQPEPPESAFSFSDSSCSEALVYRDSCQITVRFKPKHWGQTIGRLVYEVNGPMLAYGVNLVGTAQQHDGGEGDPDSRLSVAEARAARRRVVEFRAGGRPIRSEAER